MRWLRSKNIWPVLLGVSACFGLQSCGPKPPEDVVCVNSEAFRLSVVTTPVTERLIHGEPAHVPDVSGSVKNALMTAMDMDGSHSDGASHTIAVISGGGEFGAYGAGFWESFLSGRELTFDVVTGVSTGALQATAVFLRTPGDLAELTESYDVDKESELAVKKGNFLGLFQQNSAYSLAPARRQFSDYLTDDRIAAVAQAAVDGRRLLVGAVDVQDGRFYAFDLTALAASERPADEIRRCYVETVFASAAIPMIFPPIVLDGRQYFDGGVRAAAFLSSTAGAMAEMGEDHAPNVDVYALFNSYLETSPRADKATGLFEALGRTREITFNQIDRTSLQSIAEYSDEFNIRWARVEPGLCRDVRSEASQEKVFNTPFMRCLVSEGRQAGQAETPFKPIR